MLLDLVLCWDDRNLDMFRYFGRFRPKSGLIPVSPNVALRTTTSRTTTSHVKNDLEGRAVPANFLCPLFHLRGFIFSVHFSQQASVIVESRSDVRTVRTGSLREGG
jgi:hypothetical protein